MGKIPSEKRPTMKHPLYAGIKTVAGDVMPLTCSVEVDYQIGNFEYCFSTAIISDFVFSVVLGLDFLRKFGAIIKLAKEEVTFVGKGVLQGAKYFTTLDLMSGYWQISMESFSMEKTAFITYGGLFEFRVNALRAV